MTLNNYLNNHIGKTTMEGYNSALIRYVDFHKISVEQLLKEAQRDETLDIPLNERKIIGRLFSFKSYLMNGEISSGTARTYFSKVKAFYRFNGIEVPKIANIPISVSKKAMPTRNHIVKAVEMSPPNLQAFILLMSSSGMTSSQILSLKVEDFITATEDYHCGGSVESVLKGMSEKSRVVPAFYLSNVNVGEYYTFCSAEAANYIIRYLMRRTPLKKEDKLFNISNSTVISRFRRINDFNGWGYSDNYRFFRPAVLKKYYTQNIGLSMEHINMLQGRISLSSDFKS